MSSFSIRAVWLALAFALLSGCGFQPLHGDRTEQADLAAVSIARIMDRSGQQLRNALLDRLNPKGATARPLYVLQVIIEEDLQELAIRKDELVTRANLMIVAKYGLVLARDGSMLTEGTSHSITSFNIPTEEYSAIVAEQDARRRGIELLAEDIELHLALFFRRARAGSGG
jgi:LPS-assembly lipoprotein